MTSAFEQFKFSIGDRVQHKGHHKDDPRAPAGIVVTRALVEFRDANGDSFYCRSYSIIGYGIDAEATEAELELAA